MPITRARTSPPSGLLSCNVLAARALSGQTLDAQSNAMANIIFQDPSIAHSLSKFRHHPLRPNLRHPGSRGRICGPDALRAKPLDNGLFGQRTWANKRSSLAAL